MGKMKKTGTGRMQKRKNARLRHYKRSIVMICAVLVCLTGALAVGSLSLHAKNAQYKEQEERAKEVEEFEEYVKTDDYIKETAEDKLGLVDPNEIIFKPAQ